MAQKWPRRGWDEGATAVEAAIVISLFIALVFGIIEFATALWQWNTTMLAVQEAGRYAMINNATVTAAEQQMSLVISGTISGTPICTNSGGSINPPPADNPLCVFASTAGTGTTSDPKTMTLTAIYAYSNILVPSGLLLEVLPGPFTSTSQATFPLNN
jgi:Flp pilus assembly protein TadG